MFISKNCSERMNYSKNFCKTTILFSVGIIIFGIYEVSAKQMKSEDRVLLQKIIQKSDKNLISKKLRQEIEAYREKYASKPPKTNKNDFILSISEKNEDEEKISNDSSELSTKAPQEEPTTLESNLIKKDSTQKQKIKSKK